MVIITAHIIITIEQTIIIGKIILNGICGTIFNFTSQTVISDTPITGCNINVQNVKVQNNAKLTLDAINETTINGDFEVQLGSELEIK